MPYVIPLAVLRSRVSQNGSQRATAKTLGVSQQYLCDLLAGRRPLSRRMLRMLGIEIRYWRAPKEKT